MAMGRGSAKNKMSFGMAFICLLVVLQQCFVISHAAVYTVGGNGGWTFNTVGWPNGKKFKAGDTLVFQYNPKVHNTVQVNAAGYNACTAPKRSKVYQSGNDRVKLVKGTNYFICSFTGHCQAGMKIAVTAY